MPDARTPFDPPAETAPVSPFPGRPLPTADDTPAAVTAPEAPATPASPAKGGVRDQGALQEIKGRVHRRLLERLNLSNLDSLDREQVMSEIRKVVHDLLARETIPLNFEEREELVEPGPRRDLRARAAGAAPQGSGGQRHPGQRLQPGDRGAARKAREHRRPLQGRQAPDADHRADRLRRGPPDRRVVAHGRRAPARRLPRECDHSAAGHRRAAHVHPEVQAGRALGRGPAADGEPHRAHAGAAPGHREGAAQRAHLRRHRRRQDDAPQHPLVLHSARRADRHHRGLGRAPAPAAARGPAGDANGQRRGLRAPFPSGSS
jgi:hypothetical protein